MFSFVIACAVMAVIAAAVVCVPLWNGADQRRLAVFLSLGLSGAAAALYPLFSNWNWGDIGAEQQQAAELDATLAKLAEHLREDPNDSAGWIRAGRAYVSRKRLDEAVAAYNHAHQLDADNAEAALGLGETLSLKAGGSMTREVAALFEQALRLAPESPEALFYGGFAARFRGDFAAARSRWQALSEMHPTPQIKRLVDTQIAALGVTAPVAREALAQPPQTDGSSAGATVTVRISPALASRAARPAALFIFAREVGSRGPPLAAKRLTNSAIGTEIHLSAADSMIPGRSLQDGRQVVITARLSFGGQPLPATGDLYGELTYDVGHSLSRDLVIDRIVE